MVKNNAPKTFIRFKSDVFVKDADVILSLLGDISL